MTEAMNEIICEVEKWDNYRKISFMEHAAKLFQGISFLTHLHELDMPKETFSAKDLLDDYYEEDVLDVIFE